ncbi:MAG TPA: outer membrane protein assembly factor BamA [Burkholderiales bacterium]|nr:outer membrane protein assembly factor BamA [Burkholderiales bacterium]
MLSLLVLFSPAAFAFDPFVIKDIRVEGIQRTEAGTVFSYLPVKVGDRMTDDKASEAIKKLFATGFFKDVRIEVEGDVLIVAIDERPAIATVDWVGLKAFDKEQVKKINRESGLAEGRIFDRSILDRAEQELKRQYLSKGLYGVDIKTTVTPLERNRVGIVFNIVEGNISKIRKINIVGNRAFKESELLDNVQLTEGNWLSWYSKDDQYSKAKLAADLESLKSFYLNRGYLEFNVESTQVSITPDKKDIYINIGIFEGRKYTVSEIKLAGDLIVPEAELQKYVLLKAGDVYNGEKMTETTKKIQDRLGNEGYAFANANAVPTVDKEKLSVAFTIYVDPARRVYVRRVNIAGNTRTRDEVIRREMRQLEGSYYDGAKITESKRRLDRLDYFKQTETETPAVTGSPDQIDVNVKVEEKPTGQLLLGAGFSSADKVVLQTSVSQANIFGSGKTVALSLSTGRTNKVYSLSQTDPYFTVDGISRTINLYRRDFDASAINLGDYQTSSYGTGVTFGYPFTSVDTFIFGLAADHTEYSVASDAPTYLLNYVATFGASANTVPVTVGWFRDTRDSALAPRAGRYQSATLEYGTPVGDLQYAKFTYLQRWYIPLAKLYTLYLRGEGAIGEGFAGKPLPTFKRFYAGGIGSVRGYDTNSLGPRTTDGSIFGGDRRLTGSAEILFPFPGLEKDKSVRLSTFFDFGQVFSSQNVLGTATAPYTGSLRYSAGIGLNWQSPFGPLAISWANPLNKRDGDSVQHLQFAIGTTF